MRGTENKPARPKVILLSYATRNFRLSQFLLYLTAKIFGADSCILRTREDLEKTNFYFQFKHILDENRGGGFWLWKPYFIHETLLSMKENDLLLYVDAGTIIRRNLNRILKLANKVQPVILFLNDAPQFQFTKRDIFVALDCDDQVYHKAPMVHANIQLYLNCELSRNFTKSVLENCCKDRLITDDPNKLGKPDLEGFEVNRHDQSILSLLALKNGMKFYVDPTQYRTGNFVFDILKGKHESDIPYYPPCFFVHRYSNTKLWMLIKYLLPKKLRKK